jgi:hypothetical protein
MRTNALACLVLALGGVACASSQDERVHDARSERAHHARGERDHEARSERVDARTRAETKTGTVEHDRDSRREVVTDQHDVAKERILAPSQSAERVSNEGMADGSDERASYQSKAQARLDKLEVRIDAAKEKLTALGSRAPSKLNGELKTAAEEHHQLRQDLRTLPETPASRWQSTTDKFEHRIGSLDERVTRISDSIERV